ncbi:hypothetical protein CLU79DRAFT_769568 [Phycomyces nitens]|nr:hypothetical protein CLU79DRAFT_769568 [Phycomyces nitens]
MAYEFNSLQSTHQPKRRHEDDEDEDQAKEFNDCKRFNDTRESSFDDRTPVSPLPSITYAGPDYRPPPRKDALWLQPIRAADDSEDDNSTLCQEEEDCAMY